MDSFHLPNPRRPILCLARPCHISTYCHLGHDPLLNRDTSSLRCNFWDCPLCFPAIFRYNLRPNRCWREFWIRSDSAHLLLFLKIPHSNRPVSDGCHCSDLQSPCCIYSFPTVGQHVPGSIKRSTEIERRKLLYIRVD